MMCPGARGQVLRRFGRFACIKLEPSPRIAELVLLELKAELIAGSLKVHYPPCASGPPYAAHAGFAGNSKSCARCADERVQAR
jgi:hypothetical protein